MKRANSTLDRRPPLILFVAIALLLLFALSGTLVHLLTESWWFEAVGYGEVFWTRIFWQVIIWAGTLVLYAVFLLANYGLALWLTRESPWRLLQGQSLAQGKALSPLWISLVRYGAIAFTLLISFDAATKSAAAWDRILKFLNPSNFDLTEPLFQKDISFYLFRLPFFHGLQQGIAEALVWALALAIVIYLLKGEIRPERGWKYFLTGEAKTHLCLLLAGLAVVIAAGFYLERYELLFSPSGVVFGAGYTDVHARLQAHWLMAFVTLSVAVLFLIALWRSGFWLPMVGMGFYLGVLILVNGFYPWFQQQFLVAPNELVKERPYIEHNIAFTRAAYGLEQVQSDAFPAEATLTRADLTENASTVDNIRLWDYRPLLSTYRQLQEIRSYYRFQDVDIDRYILDDDYRQVMLAARELDYTEAPPEAQTWVNQRLKFTHGYGVVMSPVNRFTRDGLPELMIKNIPPESNVDLDITQPRIYYGEATRSYMFTGTSTDEFDYPLANENAVNRYDGDGGVPMGSFGRRLAYAYDLGNLKTLISNYFTGESRIHYYRNVVRRARQIAPFLDYDSDPYVTIIDGRLKWILDGYTTSNRYPYAQPLRRSNDVEAILGKDAIAAISRRGTNYIRDAAKVVVDAYDGSLQFYVMDSSDPILATYQKIFPDLFQGADTMPEAVRSHVRYPHDLFTIQSQMYRTYHMGNPEVFYNREDLWRFPLQVYEKEQVQMEPYYTIMRLPEAEEEEFIAIMPFTPVNKDNMVAWLSARSDGDEYGKLLLYEFPKQQLVYGPSQIEARIDQTPEISQQLTLWSQEGSRVIRGDLLVIPIKQSLLYVEPVYLRAEQGELPELKRIIVAYDNQVVMGETLDEALNTIFGARPVETADAVPPREETDATAAPAPTAADAPTLSPALEARIKAAVEAYDAGQAALQRGDWEAYGEAQERLGEVLQDLEQ